MNGSHNKALADAADMFEVMVAPHGQLMTRKEEVSNKLASDGILLPPRKVCESVKALLAAKDARDIEVSFTILISCTTINYNY